MGIAGDEREGLNELELWLRKWVSIPTLEFFEFVREASGLWRLGW